MKKLIRFILASSFLFSLGLKSQSDVFTEAMKLKNAGNYKDAFPAFQALLKSDSSNISYLSQGSQVYTRYGYLYLEKEKQKQKYYQIASYLAQKAIIKDEKNAEAHFAYCLALGRINEKVNNRDKISNAKLIKTEIDRTIELDPKIPNSYHILGRWNSTIAGFSKGQKKMIDRFYGGMPTGASYDEAIKAFRMAISLAPNVVLHQYELAQVYFDLGNKKEAKVELKKAMGITVVTDEDKLNMEKCSKLLKKLN